jgi:hypothetical protein
MQHRPAALLDLLARRLFWSLEKKNGASRPPRHHFSPHFSPVKMAKVLLLAFFALIVVVTANRKDIQVPYVNQRWDTPDSFGGNWACGPTSAVMAMAHFGKIKAHPIHCSSPTAHTSDYGWYVPSVYTSPTGFVFNRMQHDSNGHPAWGAYGTCTDGGGAWAWRIQDYAKHHGLVADFYPTATFSLVEKAINANQLVILSTQLTSAGHLILVRGYDSGKIIVNDPWGNANVHGYTGSGHGVTYTWAQAKTKWCVVVRQPTHAAELENLPLPVPLDGDFAQ